MLKELLDYLNSEIYPNMPTKKVKEIKSQSLGGGLMDIIKKYSESEVLKALTEERINTGITINSYKKQLEDLRSTGHERKVYRKRSDNFVND